MDQNKVSNWQLIKLKDLCHEITVGHVGPMVNEYKESGTPFLRSQNILPFRLDLSDVKFIGEDFHKKLKKSALKPGDVAIVRTGYPGTACVIPSQFPESNCADLVIIRTLPQLEPFYLTCILNSAWGRSTIAGRLVGAAQQHFNVSAAKEMYINLPPFSIQCTISNILSVYNDLIENNTRRITILEQMAQMLYQEWFVKFRFPGHEQVERVESELGVIPKGWEIAEIGDIVQVLGGGTPSTKIPEYWDNGDILWFSPTDLTSSGSMFASNSAKKITSLGLKESSARLFPAYSVLMTSRATIGVIAINTKEACTNQGFVICIPNEVLSAYQIYYWLIENRQKINNLASGATFKEINRATFKQLQVVIPPQNIGISFDEAISPIWKQIANLTQKNTILRQTRDMLLPKLISGEMDVSAWAGEEVEEVAEMLGQEYEVTEPIVRKVAETGMVTPLEKDGLEQPSLWG